MRVARNRKRSVSVWQAPPQAVLEPIFERLRQMDDSGTAQLHLASHVCSRWRAIAKQMLLDDTAVSKPVIPPAPRAASSAAYSVDSIGTRGAIITQASTSQQEAVSQKTRAPSSRALSQSRRAQPQGARESKKRRRDPYNSNNNHSNRAENREDFLPPNNEAGPSTGRRKRRSMPAVPTTDGDQDHNHGQNGNGNHVVVRQPPLDANSDEGSDLRGGISNTAVGNAVQGAVERVEVEGGGGGGGGDGDGLEAGDTEQNAPASQNWTSRLWQALRSIGR